MSIQPGEVLQLVRAIRSAVENGGDVVHEAKDCQMKRYPLPVPRLIGQQAARYLIVSKPPIESGAVAAVAWREHPTNRWPLRVIMFPSESEPIGHFDGGDACIEYLVPPEYLIDLQIDLSSVVQSA